MVKYEALGREPYELDDEGLCAIGQRSGDVVRLGDRMVVRIEDVSIERRQVYGARLAALTVDGQETTEPQRPKQGKRGQGHGDVRDKKLAQRRTRAAAENKRKGKAAKPAPKRTPPKKGGKRR
jgi:hypothetical protein